MTTLATIRTKVRRLTASPSELQLTDAIIDEYINTFYLHDLPQYLKLFDLKKTVVFYTEPGVDVYDLIVNPSFTDASIESYYSIEPPVYVGGYVAGYTQSRSEFYNMYPPVTVTNSIAGDGGAGAYAITITNTPVIRGSVTLSADAGAGVQVIAYDDGVGGFTGDVTAGAIDYDTGAITAVIFTSAIPTSSTIYARSVPYVASRPTMSLFYDNKFTLRPIPDKTYRVELDAYVYPTVLLNATDSPDVQFLWQVLAIGAAIKIFEDRGDVESVSTNEKSMEKQLLLCGRRTIEQNRPVRAATIYASNSTGDGNLNYRGY